MPAPTSTAHQAPPSDALLALMSNDSVITRYAQIVNSDGSIFKDVDQLGFTDGSVSVDQTRAERRSFSLVLDNRDGSLRHSKEALWYDKIFKLWRGVKYGPNNSQEWNTQVGEFMIDSITTQSFPHTVQIQGRDYTKKLINSQFKQPTGFPKGRAIEDIIKVIATNGGIDPRRMILPVTGHYLGEDTYYDAGSKRWDAVNKLADDFGYELYFDGSGTMVMRPFQDPSGTGSIFRFEVGANGTLVKYEKVSNDSRLYNSVSVIGEAANKIPIYGSAENHEPSSSTSIERIGERVYNYKSSFIYTQAQADAVAAQFLSFHSLEEYTVNLDSIVFPWFEAGDIIEFIDPDADPTEPSRFLLSSFAVPFKLGSMSLTTKRVVIV